MNPFLNPRNLFGVLKWYLTTPSRIKKQDEEKIKKYRDRAFRRMVRYAYTVPLYHEKYRKAGIKPEDIRGIEDIKKLPFVTKEEIRRGFPDKILPAGCDRKKFHVVCTGGTTGKPISIYVDFLTIAQSAINLMRELRFFGFDWRKVRLAHIGNLSSHRIDLVVENHFLPHVRTFFSMENFLNMDVNKHINEIMKELDKFKPDLIITYPAIHLHLASLKKKGYGNNVNPKLLWTGGAMLDDYTRRYVEEAFGCRLLNIYPSVESQSNIAFECLNGKWHINYDLFHVEAIDEDGEVVSPGERGHMVLTRLWGRGTPIIRYTGMDDWIKLSDESDCACGLRTPTLINGVEGRIRSTIILPDGKIFPPGAFCFISPVLHKLKTFKVKQYQIIQRKIDQIEILLVIDENLRDVGPPVELICEKIKEVYREKVGPGVEIIVREVDEIKNEKNPSKPPPIVISYVKENVE